MSVMEKMINASMNQEDNVIRHLSCSATLDWTELATGKSVGTTTTSGVYKMAAPECIIAVSAGSDGEAIIWLPPAQMFPGKVCIIHAPTGATGGDINVHDEVSGGMITTYGDLDADADHVIFISTGLLWVLEYDGVA